MASPLSTAPPTAEPEVDDDCELPRTELEMGLIVFLEPEAHPDEIESVRRFVEGDDRVIDWQFVSQSEALDEFAELFADTEELVAAVTPDVLPTSFRLHVASGEVDALADELGRFDGIKDVVMAPDWCDLGPAADLLDAWDDIEAMTQEVVVFLQPERHDAVEAVRSRVLEVSPGPVTWVSQQDALIEFECQFGTERFQDVTADDLPASFRFDADPGNDASAIMRELRGLDGVSDVVLKPRPESMPPDPVVIDELPFGDPRCRVEGELVER